jgi:glycerophosphoryl diester phosphodiesterase
MINTVQTSDDMLKAEDAREITDRALAERKMKSDDEIVKRHSSGLYNYLKLMIQEYASKGLFQFTYTVNKEEDFKYRHLIRDFEYLGYKIKVTQISSRYQEVKKYTISWKHDTASSTL